MNDNQTQSPQLPEDIARALNGQINVAHWVRATAQVLNVRYAPTQLDDIASAISHLPDAEVEPDEIEQLLLALQRRGVITDQQRFTPARDVLASDAATGASRRAAGPWHTRRAPRDAGRRALPHPQAYARLRPG